MKPTYEELEAQIKQLAAENAVLKAFGDKLYSMYKGLETSGGGFHDEQSIPYQQAALDAAMSAFEEIETPATDAFLAEVRASSLDEFARAQDEQAKKYYELSPGCSGQNECQFAAGQAWYFAECIRKGVQS
ncbi:TPA: hypothetical protein SLH12_000525 [Citrobacter koseri]|nr:hypothetical protein [Citrobacter koseri]